MPNTVAAFCLGWLAAETWQAIRPPHVTEEIHAYLRSARGQFDAFIAHLDRYDSDGT